MVVGKCHTRDSQLCNEDKSSKRRKKLNWYDSKISETTSLGNKLLFLLPAKITNEGE